jgi:hypothetical protein
MPTFWPANTPLKLILRRPMQIRPHRCWIWPVCVELPGAVPSAIGASRPRLCENHRRPDQSDGTRQKNPLWFDSVHFSWVSLYQN